MGLGRKAKLGQKFMLYLFFHPITSISQASGHLEAGFPATARLIADFERLGMLKKVTEYSRNRLFALSEYIALFK